MGETSEPASSARVREPRLLLAALLSMIAAWVLTRKAPCYDLGIAWLLPRDGLFVLSLLLAIAAATLWGFRSTPSRARVIYGVVAGAALGTVWLAVGYFVAVLFWMHCAS